MKPKLSLRALFLGLVIAGAGVAAVTFTSTASAFPPATLTKIVCNGLRCGGVGPTQYRWEVAPGNTTPSITFVDVGVHSLISATNIVAPTGWSFTFISVAPTSFPDHSPMTAHGTGTTSNSGCMWTMHWFGPAQSAPFVLGFDSAAAPHDVTWVDSNGSASTFARPVGNGLGPIHSPLYFFP